MTQASNTTRASADAVVVTPSSGQHLDGPPPSSGRGKRKGRYRSTVAPYGFLTPTFVLLLVLMVTPITMVIGYSFVDRVIINPNSDFVGFENYAQVLTDSTFFTALQNTLVFSTASVVAHFVLGMASH